MPSAQSESADTKVTLVSQPASYAIGIMATQKIVSHPLTRRMNTGSPCTDAQRLRTTLMHAAVLGKRQESCAGASRTPQLVVLPGGAELPLGALGQ
jgi:hypothetical protein